MGNEREKYRQPTLDEAVDWINRSITREYCVKCIDSWRKLYGDAFADAVLERVKTEWKNKK
ncbi:hypothetical protein [Nitrosomonas oligotropha]|uniref:hypothetical protein n=1 Tax=Nitrosomonas oligotropha TaxID=42354 RepID=UPI000B801AF6|nr:hypothetical protein [Nitrosomonas oligotropha]